MNLASSVSQFLDLVTITNTSQALTEDDMVYTDERLKRALDVFRESEPYRKRRGLPGINLGRFLEGKSRQYETRSGNLSLPIRTTVSGTWNDKDESDDYTPRRKKGVAKSQKAVQNSTKRKRCDVVLQERNKGSKRSKVSYTSGRQNGLCLTVTFKFKSEPARAKIAALFPAPFLDVELDWNRNHMIDCDRGGDGDQFLLPPAQDSSFPPRKLATHASEPNEWDVEFAGSTSSAIEKKTQHHGLTKATASDPIIIDDSDDSSTGYGDLLDDAGTHDLTGHTKIIKTNWAHPIDYRCKPEACNFCQDFRYSLFGCGAVDVEVIQLEPGVYEEMGGGHREKGMTPTKICLNCSIERIAIAKCPRHQVLRIDGCMDVEFDYGAFLRHVSTTHHPEHPTCSICIRPACHACATRQNEDPFGLPITGDGVCGCGLLLCNDCAGVVASCGLDMDHIEEKVGSSKMLRADREFLLPGSDLWQAWRK
jgi:hypothetical protein